MISTSTTNALAPGDRNAGLRASQRGGGSLLISLSTLYRLTLRQHMHGKRWIIMAALFLLPVGLAVLLRATAPNIPNAGLEFIIIFMFVPQAILPLVALVYASGIVQDEQEDQTLTYLLIRPIPKWALYITKLLATLTTTIMLTVAFTALTFVAVYLGGDSGGENIPLRCLKAAAIGSLAVVAYCCIFGLMSLLTKRTLIAGILYIAVIEGLFANFPFSIRLLTVIYHTRLIAYRALTFIVSDPRGAKVDIAAEAWQLEITKDPNLLEHPAAVTSLTVLLVASMVCALLAALMCNRREFYVKTPEKN